jgi:HEPN domain-containing protein
VRKQPALNSICFHAQQSAEKYLKARLCELGLPVPRTHDLTALLEALQPAHPEWRLLEPAAKALLDYAVRFRYPGASADRLQARTSVKDAILIRDAVRLALELPIARAAGRKQGRRSERRRHQTAGKKRK